MARTIRVQGAVGREISDLWDALERQRLLPGVGQRLRETSHGVYLDIPRVCCETVAAGDTEPPPPDPVGACCNPDDGTCQLLTEALCLTPSIWQGADTVCDPNPCPPPPPVVWACCNPITGGCSMSESGDCVAPSIWHDGSTCDVGSNPCAMLGACCDASGGGCVEWLAEIDCPPCVRVIQGDIAVDVPRWHAGQACAQADCADEPCPPLPPPPVTGRCCDELTGCSITTAAACAGAWGGAGTTCSPDPCPVGRCCGSTPPLGGDYICNSTTQELCERLLSLGGYQGTWGGAGSTCLSSPCGRCCAGLEDCFWRSADECTALGGTFTGGDDCADNPCQPPSTDGACCNELGVCVIAAQANCLTPSTFLGIGTTCSPNLCPQPATGRCCLSNWSCVADQTEAQCAAQIMQPATWTEGGACPGDCVEPTGSCCDASTGACSQTVQGSCGGLWTQGQSCSPNPCSQPPTGRCCVGTSCSITTAAACVGTWGGAGTTCAGSPCAPATGKCCSMMGGCIGNGYTAAQCSSAGGFWTQGATCTNQWQC